MAFPLSLGLHELSGSWKPGMFSQNVLVKYYKTGSVPLISNTNWVGEIKKMGDKVTIRSRGNVTVRDYVDGQTLVRDHLNPGSQDLLIDKGKTTSFGITSIEAKQVDLPMDTIHVDDASRNLGLKIDAEILQSVTFDVHAANTGATAGKESGTVNLGASGAALVPTDANILDIIVATGLVLDEQQVPPDGRWLVVPHWFYARIKTSDLKDASLAGDGTSILRTGNVKLINDMTIIKSSNLLQTPAQTAWSALFGHKDALTFAAQMTESRVLPNFHTFGLVYDSLTVYGFKVVKPEAIGRLFISPT